MGKFLNEFVLKRPEKKVERYLVFLNRGDLIL